MASPWKDWVVERFGIKPLTETVLHRRVAKGAWYYGDGATLMLLIGVQVATGAMMMLTYAPTPDAAYETVQHITNNQTMGWFVRALHYWSAGLVVVMLMFHLFRQILVGGYKQPREGTWLIGIAMFFLLIVMSFTGYVLRWDERAIYAIRVALHIFQKVPFVGDWLVIFVQGGAELGPQTLTRVYAVHVLFVPLLLFFLVGFHLYLVMLHGVTSPTERRKPVHSVEEQKQVYHEDADSERYGESFFPDTAAKSGMMAFVVFGAATILAITVGPAPLYPKANLVDPSFPAEEWWFAWYSTLTAILPNYLVQPFHVLFPILLAILLIGLPFIDRNPYRGMRKRPAAVIVVTLSVLTLFLLSDIRRASPWTAWPLSEPPSVPEGAELTPQAEEGRLLFARYGCNSCHPIAGEGRPFAQDLAQLDSVFSLDEIQKYILNPPEGIPMPSYEGRIPQDDLERVAEFVHVAQTFSRER